MKERGREQFFYSRSPSEPGIPVRLFFAPPLSGFPDLHRASLPGEQRVVGWFVPI